MMSFRNNRLRDLQLPMSSVWLSNDIAEAKGRHELYVRQAPQILKVLRETALIQSVESSNRIEGVTVSPERLRPLVLGNTKPRDRSEQEIQGYRRALAQIHATPEKLEITPRLLLEFHALIQGDSGDAGQWKRVDNEIVELRPGAAPVVRFRPTPAAHTPTAISELCTAYERTIAERGLPSLLTIAALVLDFLCIHPFRDGNGRVSRLLSLLALYQQGHFVGRYVSLERLVEQDREGYYESLGTSSQGWHEGVHDLLPWLNYFLSVLHRAYRDFETRAGEVKSPRGAKTALVESAIDQRGAEFSLADILRACPGVSQDMIRRVLRTLQRNGAVRCLGRGPGARWRKAGNTLKRG